METSGRLLHPCLFCGGSVAVEQTDGGGFVVACPSCGMAGPESRESADEAASAWGILATRQCNHCRKWLISAYTSKAAAYKAQIQALGGVVSAGRL